jgi:microcystin-dependent protein
MDNFLGQIIMLATNYAPKGYLRCDGSILNIAEYQALYSLLGTTYGGDGKVTFGIPNLIDKMPVDTKDIQLDKVMVSGHGVDTSIKTISVIYCICVEGLYPTKD